MEQTIYFRVAKGDEPHKLTGFKDTDTDTTINLFFDGKCGGVYKWWRGNKEDEPEDLLQEMKEDHDLLELNRDLLDPKLSDEKKGPGYGNVFSAEYKPPFYDV